MGFSKQEYWSGCGYFKTLCIFPVTRSYSKIEDFPCGLAVKNLSVMQETRIDKGPRFHPWVRKIHWRRKWQPTPVFLPGKTHGQRSLAGYSPWGCKEAHTTERLHSLTHSLTPVAKDWKHQFSFQSQRKAMKKFKLPHSCTHLTCCQSNAENSPS